MREIRTTLLPNGEQQVQAGGDFVYVDYVDREIKLMIHDQVITVNPGDKVRPPRPFKSVSVINPDSTNPVAVVLKVGEGDYNSQIIRGEVSVNPGIRGANGEWVDDTRSVKTLNVSIGSIEARSYAAGDLIRTPGGAPHTSVYDKAAQMTFLTNSRVLFCDSDGEYWHLGMGWPDSLQTQPIGKLGHGAGAVIGKEVWIPKGIEGPQGYGIVAVMVYDKRTLKFRRQINTEILWTGTGGNPQVAWAAYLPKSNTLAVYAVSPNGYIHFLTPEGKYKRPVYAAGVNHGRYGAIVRGGRFHAIGGSGNNGNGVSRVFDEVTLEPLPWSDAAIPNISVNAVGAALTPRDTIIYCDGHGGRQPRYALDEYAIEDVTISASGSVSSCEQAGMLKADRFETKAEIYAERLESGRVLLSGEVVRAVLEIYFGKYVPDNYLDYVYQVEAEELDGVLPAVISAGGESFKAAGIKDDAAATFPQQIKVTLREGLF